MKSLKSVLVVAFACAMLFAFTACEQAPINMPSSDADKAVAKVTFVSSDTAFYEGESYGNVPVVVDVTYKDGSVTENVTALMSVNDVKAGSNAFPTVLTATANNPNNYLVEVQGIAIEGLEIVAGEDFTNNILTITEEEYGDWTPASGISLDPESVKILYADGTTSKALERKSDGGYTVNYDSTDKTKVTSAVFKYGIYTESLPVSIETPAPVTPDVAEGEISAYLVDSTGAAVENFWVKDTVTLKVVQLTDKGNIAKTLTTADYSVAQDGVLIKDPATEWTLSEKSQGTYEVVAYVTTTDGEVVKATDSFTVPAGVNYMKTPSDYDALVKLADNTTITAGKTVISKDLLAIDTTKLEYAMDIETLACADTVVVDSVLYNGYTVPAGADSITFEGKLAVTIKGETSLVDFEFSESVE